MLVLLFPPPYQGSFLSLFLQINFLIHAVHLVLLATLLYIYVSVFPLSQSSLSFLIFSLVVVQIVLVLILYLLIQ